MVMKKQYRTGVIVAFTASIIRAEPSPRCRMSSSVRLNSDCSKRRFAKIHQRLRNGRDDPDEDAITSHHSLPSRKYNSLLLRV